MSFAHLHVHTQYSILDGLSNISDLFARARELSLSALAITDHGNLYGVKEFLKVAFDKKNFDSEGKQIVKPIIGCEVYVTRHYDHTIKQRGYYHLILLAKNYNGYMNLVKLVSEAHLCGMYYGKPRISHELLEKYHSDLICSSACIAGEIAVDILSDNMEEAEKAVRWHKSIFGEDYYLEVMLHKTQVENQSLELYHRQQKVCQGVFELAGRTGVKVIATNDAHFVRAEDGPAHDRLICLTTNARVNDPNRLHYTQQEYLKSEEEMASLFPEHPEVLENTLEVASKIESFKIDRDHVLPKYNIDPSFLKNIDRYLEEYSTYIEAGKYTIKKDKQGNELSREYRGDDFCTSVAFLCHLTFEGARKRYGPNLTEEQSSRIDFELNTICKMGFPDYFLIVQDYIMASRKMGYMVGPGRGSAAGSVVAYCLGITNIDPLKYDLLFERFLNPDRISMPDIDVDFENLKAAHDYVENTYKADHVSRVITFGTMKAKSAIKDVARISDLPLDESIRLTKLIPDHLSEKKETEEPFNPELDELKPGFKIIEKEVEVDDPDKAGAKKKITKKYQKGLVDTDVKINLSNCYRLVPELKDALENGSELVKDVLKYAKALEGCIRQTGVHACATIIGRGDLTDYIPLTEAVDAEGQKVHASQYDGHYIEDVGMLKMDFLGLATLEIIHRTLDNIKENFGYDIDIEDIPIDDPSTYDLYGKGDTVAVFQFESEGMQTHLSALKPNRFEDLIAMNALYRPGPMQYIPSYIARKWGKEKIEYDLPVMSKYLEDTYGITVYQEQVMLLSRLLADFTPGEADKLRKAMGKKQLDVLESLQSKFMEGGKKNGHPEKVLDKIWKDWRKFAEYAFNKSHATCYAWVSYQTAYLKAHYPSEFFAANLCLAQNIDDIRKLMADAILHNKRIQPDTKIKILSPDVNESEENFVATAHGDIRFGLSRIKGFSSAAAKTILDDRHKRGPFESVFDFVERNASVCSVKVLESLVQAGALDSFGIPRTTYLIPSAQQERFVDLLAKFAEMVLRDDSSDGMSLFGGDDMKPTPPDIPQVTISSYDEELDILHKEKEILGLYLSSHPLGKYALEASLFSTMSVADIPDCMEEARNTQTSSSHIVAVMVTKYETKSTQDGKKILLFTIEDETGSFDMRVNARDYDRFISYFHIPHPFLLMDFTVKSYKKKETDTTEAYMQVDSIMDLANASINKVKCLKIHVNAKTLDVASNKALSHILKSHKGETPIVFVIYDAEKNYIVELAAGKCRVELSQTLIEELQGAGFVCAAIK